MAEYEPEDSRTVTHGKSTHKGEPPRTGPREGETRRDDGDDGEAASRTGGVDSEGEDTPQPS